jgi:ankyrin repeat protein
MIDIIEAILSVAIETVQWPDAFGWLPIHYACACGADTAVIKKLAEEFPASKTTVDRRGRTPLHFALGNQNPDQMATPQVVAILSSTGAASVADEHGMLVS